MNGHTLSQEQIRTWLKTLQRQNVLAKEGPTLKSVAERSSLDRSTLYACIDGDHIELHSQIRLSRAIEEIEEERTASGAKPTKLLSIRISNGMPSICIGMTQARILK